MKKVLVTGASGFIGMHLMKYLVEQGNIVRGWDISARDGMDIVSIDMLSCDDMQKDLAFFEPDVVFHCAGAADVGKSMRDPLGDYQGNVTLTHNMFEAIASVLSQPVTVIFISSAAVYGDPNVIPISESAKIAPKSQYALHKIMCEQLCDYYNNYSNINVRVARIFSAYGEGLKKQIFWDMYNKIISTGKLEMFGTGSESRDYIYIKDLVKALYLIATSEKAEFITNVANGEEIQIKEVASIFARSIGIESDKVSFNNISMIGAPNNWKADISKLTQLGYEQEVGLEEGIKRYLNWIYEE